MPLFSAEAWSPLKVELFRSLYIATSIAQIGTWMREAAGPWLMKVLTDGWQDKPAMVARVLVFSNLPIMLLSVFAGGLADVLDRRRLLIVTQLWMLVVSVVLGVMTLFGMITPGLLLALTFLLGVGTAASGPALQAVLPELVPPKEMALAINLNSVALNVARAIGPALFILVVSVPGLTGKYGVGTSFILSGMTFVGSVWVLFKWKRAPQRAAVHGESFLGAIRAGFNYTVYSRANRAILFRVLAFIVPAVVMWSQVPIIATEQLHLRGEQSYALLFAFVGLGAILGVLLMPGLHKRFKIDPVVNTCTLIFAMGLIALSFVHSIWLAAPIMLLMGVNWVIIPTNFNTATQKSVPPWVKGRAISFYLTVLFGSFALGGAIWGRVTTSADIATSLQIGGGVMALMLLLAPRFPLTLNEGLDLSPAFGKDAPVVPFADGTPPPSGAVNVVVNYQIDPAREADFRTAMVQLASQRKRNGARAWKLVAGNVPGQFKEHFGFASRKEFDRQPGRLVKADLALQAKASAFHTGGEPVRPTVEA